MNDKHHTPPELPDRIERFFDCSLSDEEEAALRRELAGTTSDHPAICEAQALMGFHSIPRDRIHRHSPERLKRIILRCAAAAVLVAIVCPAILYYTANSSGSNGCIAYFNGSQTTDEQEVLAIVFEEISELKEGVALADGEVMEDLGEIIPITQSNPI